MKAEWRRFAPLGLYLSGAAILVAAGLYVVQRQFNLAIQISLGLFVIGLALFALLDPERVRRFLVGRQARYGSNALVLTLAFVGILVVVNYLVYHNTKRWDLTEDKQFTLAPESLNTLQSLPEKVTARAFYSPRASKESAERLLEQFKLNSNGRFDYEFIDPEKNPVVAEQAKITQDSTIVLYMGDRQQSVRFASEQELAGGLVRLMNPESQTIYFLSGHGEYIPDVSGDQSMSLVKRTLESKNYKVETLNLLATNQIPDEAKVIVIAGPRNLLSEAEISQLKDFLSKGRGLVVMQEPRPLTNYGEAADPLANYLLQDWGIEYGENIIVDLTSSQPFAPFAAQYGQHPITQPIQRTTTQFPTARSATAAATAGAGVSLVNLVLTAPQSWAETNLKGLEDNQQQIQFDDGQDTSGPISLAVAGENFETKSRVVAFGDADFAIDVNFPAYANGDLLVNAIDWAVGQEQLISLTPKNSTPRMMLPPQTTTLNLIFLGTVIVLPGLALVGGVWTFIQRRRRG
ncbi:MAG: GldG family protein [Anaerolineales bacterium]|nr:GldG family protein [Anaerolineales bacterium]